MDQAESAEKNFLPHNRKDDAYDTKCMGTGSRERFDAIREWEAVRMSLLFFTLMQVLYIYKHK